MTTHYATSAAEYTERTRDENKARELHPSDMGRIDLDTFSAMTQNGRRQVWAIAADSDKRGLVLQILRSKNIGPDAVVIAMYLQAMELKFTPDAQPISPEVPVSVVQETASDLAAAAHTYGDKRAERALDKAAFCYASGVRPALVPGGMLVPSATTSGQVYRVSDVHGCNCAAGEKQIACWHLHLSEILQVAMERWGEALDATGEACTLDRLAA